ncbi:MAG: hypothetical protein J6V72_02635 [Kiritimatiellae bacterium]|nr:hypothetical protein [Kiritimatiellia bacterium]
MITPTQMYWLTRLDSISKALLLLLFILPMACLLMTVVGMVLRVDSCFNETEHATGKKLHKAAIWLVCSWLLVLVCHALTPTTREAAAIVVVPAIASSEKVQNIGNGLYDLAVDWLEELKPRKEGAK